MTPGATASTATSPISYQLIEQQERLLEYLAEAESLLPVDTQVVNIQLPLLRPKIGAVIFDVPELAQVSLRVSAQQLRDAHLPSGFVPRSILHMPNTLVLVGDLLEGVDWSLSHEMVDHDWHYFIIFHDVERRLLFIGSSMLKELHDGLAAAVSGGVATRFIGPTVLRVFGNINRLRFLQAGVMKIGGRRHRYSMVTGQDVKGAIEAVSGESASPSNFTGVGYSGGLPCSVGCSVKGKVWARDDGNISEFRSWCQGVGRKLRDTTLNTEAILDLSLLAVSVDVVPNDILALDAMWPNSILAHDEARVEIGPPSGAGEKFYVCDLAQVEMAADRKSIAFDVIAGANMARMRMTLDGGPAKGFSFVHETGPVLEVRIGRTVRPLTEYFQDEPVSFLFSDGSELEGSFHFPVRGFESSFPDTSLHPVAWTGVDIQKESIWDEGVARPDSIQQRSFEICRDEGFELIFNDDDHGEAADLVCMRREANKIHIRLVHCKFSHEATPGVRLADVVEVASQAVRSARWRHSFETLCEHILHRERVLFGKPEGFR